MGRPRGVSLPVLGELPPRLVEAITGSRQLVSPSAILKPECTAGLTSCSVSAVGEPSVPEDDARDSFG